MKFPLVMEALKDLDVDQIAREDLLLPKEPVQQIRVVRVLRPLKKSIENRAVDQITIQSRRIASGSPSQWSLPRDDRMSF